MNITAIRTKKVVVGDKLEDILETWLLPLQKRDIVVITSKIVSICEGRVVKNDGSVDKKQLIRKESDAYFEDGSIDRYGVTLTINRSILIANAGIDESNGNGCFILWPSDPFQSAAYIWKLLRIKHHHKKLGVIIADSHITPLRWGTRGLAIAWCGFRPLKDYIGTPDIFGKKLRVTKQNIADDLAAAANVLMGEGDEQTPLAVIRDIPSVSFQDRPPTKKEIAGMKISLKDDMYAPLLTSIQWEKGA